uniref:Cep57 centrosome localisation domain-containing protein n=1 Tax=Maylandia zebra TaxID=106582 RepID=A0A3P9DUB3_9CICH
IHHHHQPVDRYYPAHRPFINTLVHHRPQTHTHQSYVPSSPIKAFPETNSTVILSALRNLQEKIRRLEMEKGHAERMLINHLAAAESRCLKLERQLDHMRRMLRNARTERTNLLKQQVKSEWQSDTASQYAQFDKLERLEREYLRLTRTQNISEMKILELEMKLQEEEYQRKLIQDKANQLQTGLDASRILLQSVSPFAHKCRFIKKKSSQQYSHTEPHYRLSLRDVPFVAGTSVGCSHSVRANVQSVLSLLKRHQPHLCNSRVLSRNTNGSGTDGHRHSDSSSSSSSASGEELSELVFLRVCCREHDELMRQVEDCVFEQERKELRRVQERLLLKMERKGEQISKLYKSQLQQSNGNELRVSTTVSTRGHSAAAVKARPGDRSKMNLRLLRDMKALQTSLRT